MITVHHLNESRSQRILWLLEELGTPYTVVDYKREPTRYAPPELQRIHPLGKAPVIEDGALVLTESGAIVDYLITTYGNGRLAPSPGTPERLAYNSWLHYAEGSAMVPLLLFMYVGRLGEHGAVLHPRIDGEIANHLGYVSGALGEAPFLLGTDLTGADIMMSFVCQAARAMGKLSPYPNLGAYLDRLHARDAWKRSLERGGPYRMGA